MIEHRLPFGVYKGCPLRQVRKDYLAWLLRTCKLSSGLRVAVRAELLYRGTDPSSLPPEPPPEPAPNCQRCGSEEMAYGWYEDRLGRRHVRRSCGRCGKRLGFAPQVPPYTELADAAATPTAVLDVLTQCDALDIALKSDGQAADFVTREDYLRAGPALRDKVAQCRATLGRLLGKHWGV
jgi:hypothetical protein